MAKQRIITEWQDAAGGFLRTGGWVADGANPVPYLDELQMLSNDAVYAATVAAPFYGSEAATSDVTYWLTTDTAVLIFNTSEGARVNLVIPGPKAEIFKPGSLIVDKDNALVAALISAATGVLADSAGNAVTEFVSGVRSSRRVEQNAPDGS